MKIALCCSDILPDGIDGGIAVYTQNLATGLVQRGHDVTILARTGGQAESRTVGGIKTIFLPNADILAPHPKLKLLASRLGRARSLKNHLKRNRYDVVEFPVWDAEGLSAIKLKSFKSVVRGHTPRLIVNELMIEAGYGISKTDHLIAKLEAKSARRADLFLANSNVSLQRIQELFGLSPHKVRTCLHGVPIPDEVCDVQSNPVRILFVGRFEPRKGINEVLEIIPKVLDKYPDVRFELVGSLFPPDLFTYPTTGKPTGITPEHMSRVGVHGKVSDEDLLALRMKCQIAVLPSLYESFGFVHAEAMSYGVPTVAFDIGATRELIKNDETGILVPPKDTAALERAVASLIDSPDLRLRIGHAGRVHTQQHLSIAAMAECVEGAYQSLL